MKLLAAVVKAFTLAIEVTSKNLMSFHICSHDHYSSYKYVLRLLQLLLNPGVKYTLSVLVSSYDKTRSIHQEDLLYRMCRQLGFHFNLTMSNPIIFQSMNFITWVDKWYLMRHNGLESDNYIFCKSLLAHLLNLLVCSV